MGFKLEKVEVKNFLSYKDTKFADLNNYNVLIGKNNAGKSNLFKLFKLISRNITFENRYLFNSDDGLDASISLTFKLSDDFRREIFESLYKANLLNKIFQKNEEKEEFLPRNIWNQINPAIDWLLTKNFLNGIILTIKYSTLFKSLCIEKISGIHESFEKPIPLLSTVQEGNNILVHFITDEIHVEANNFLIFFGQKLSTKKYGYPGGQISSALNSLTNSDLLKDSILIRILLLNFNDYFKNLFVYIPAYRQFLKTHPIKEAERRNLEENGENFIQFIFRQENDPEGKIWMDELNNDLKTFFPNLKTFSQEFGADHTEVYYYEEKLDMKVNRDFMGSALLHIAFILAHLKKMEENQIILIEEPELFIFSGLQKELRKFFLEKSKNFQIFITTHSREFISENEDFCSIYSVKKEGNQSIAYEIPKEKIPDVYVDLDLDIREYEKQKDLLYNEAFWGVFIKKVIQENEIENKLWDFKQTIEMWKVPKELKEDKQVDFCENVASFANNEGGVLIVGITDTPPRKLVGVEQLESKIQVCHEVILRYTKSKRDFFHFLPVHLKNEDDEIRTCLVIIIAQTKKVIGVRHKNGLWAYKRRLQTGKKDFDLPELEDLKKDILYDNYNYLRNLKI